MFGPRTIGFRLGYYTVLRAGAARDPRFGKPLEETLALCTLASMMRDEQAARGLRALYAELSHNAAIAHHTNDDVLSWYRGQLRAGVGGLTLLARTSFALATDVDATGADSQGVQEARRIDALLGALGNMDLQHRGSGYRITRAEANKHIARRSSLEVLDEREAKRVLDELAQDPRRGAAQHEALRALAASCDKLRASPVLQLLVLRRYRLFAAPVEEKAVTPSQLRKQREVHWVELQIEDSEGNALAGVACEVTLPDGTKVTAVSDDLGYMRIDGAGGGQCSVSLPKYDAKLWSAA